MTRIFVEPVETGGFRLRTDRGEPVGARLLSVDPEEGRSLPDVESARRLFDRKSDAVRTAFEWNLYLMWVRTHKTKKAKKGEER